MWQAVVNVANNFGVPLKCREFLASWTGGFAGGLCCAAQSVEGAVVCVHAVASTVSCERRFVPQRGSIVQDRDQRPSRPFWRSVPVKVRRLCRSDKAVGCSSSASTRHALCSASREALLAATAILTL